MSNIYRIPTTLLRFLGACVYGDARLYYAGLNESECVELKTQGKDFGMSAWIYRYLYDVLPDASRTEYQTLYLSLQARAMIGEQELKRLYSRLAEYDLRFVAIKGADLTYRLYPDAALRIFEDWDIWFHPDDCERAITILEEDGWKAQTHYSTIEEVVKESGMNHFPAHIRGKYIIEPHFTLPNFNGIAPLEMWEQTIPYPNGDGQRILSPEMNLLMLTRHAASKSYYHAHIPKLLTDAAMIMNDKVDFEIIRDLASRWHLPYPGDFLAAFPDFFPEEQILKFSASQAKAGEFHKVFEQRAQLGEIEIRALMLSRYKARGHLKKGLLKHIHSLNVRKIRRLYHLPKTGAWGRVAWSYVLWFWTRSRQAYAWIQNPQLKSYGRLVESIESGANTSV